MARTYTITVTDDETGAVIFTGRPTGHMLMVLESDRAGRLVCDRCESPVAEDLAGMDAEGPTDGSEDDELDPCERRCLYCSEPVVWRQVHDEERHGLVEQPLRAKAHAWADTTGASPVYCPRSPDFIHHTEQK